MKKFIAMALIAVSLAACSDVPAGHVGVKVHKYGSDKGVQEQVLGPGRYWLTWNEELFLFPTFSQTECWTKGANPECGSSNDEEVQFQTSEGLRVSADVGMTYSVNREKIVLLFQKFRKGVREISDVYLRNMVQDELNNIAATKSVEDVYGRGKVDMMTAVERKIRDTVSQYGIDVENIYWKSNIRLPQSVQASLDKKIEAIQMTIQRQNEVAQAKAEADKKIEHARGEGESILVVATKQAEANKVVNQSLTPELVRYKAIEKWDGILPKFSGGGVVPFIDLDKAVETKK